MVLDLVEKSTLMVWVTIGEALTISILLCCNEPRGYCDSIAIVELLLLLLLKLSKLSIVYYTIAIVISVSFLLSIHCNGSVNIVINEQLDVF